LKHLWCMGEIPEPPQCPVDRIILKAAGCEHADRSWCYVNSLEEHRNKVEMLKRRAEDGSATLAVWELLKFSN